MRVRSSSILFALLSLISAGILAQTSGSLVGRTTDESGGSLPGVTVEAKSPSLQGTRVTTTDSAGRYRLTLLPPGTYAVSFTLSGFAIETRAGIVVSLGKDSTVDSVLRPAAKESVVVTAEAPVVDTTSSELGTNLSTRSIETLPTGRNYSAITQVVPGV